MSHQIIEVCICSQPSATLCLSMDLKSY